MLTASETLYLSVKVQLLLTVFLVVLLWALYARLRKFEFFLWWAWAWTAFAVYLATASVSLHVGPAWTPLKACLIFVLLLSGFLEVALLVFGGMSWRAPDKPSRRLFWAGLGFAVLAASICFFLGFRWRANPVASMAVRNLTRTFALSLALFFCFWVFWRQFRLSRSWAAAITGIFCFAYAIDQSLYFLAFAEVVTRFWGLAFPSILHRLANIEILSYNRLLFFDLLDTCGICLGMILLLVERYKLAESELAESQRRSLGLAADNVSLQLEIQKRLRSERQLRESEELSRQIVLHSPVAMLVARGTNEKALLVNEKFTDLFGYTLDDVHDVSEWWPRAYPDQVYRQAVQAQWQSLIDQADQGGTDMETMEARVCCKDGSFRDIEFHLSRIDDLYLVSFVNLTERKQAEAELREGEAKFRLVADTVTSAIWVLQDNRVLYFNKEFETISGYPREEILSMNPWDLVHPDFREESYLRSQARLRGEPVADRYQFPILAKSSEKRWVEFSGVLTEWNGKPAILASAFDITATKRAEQELQEHAMYMDALISNSPLGIVVKDQNQLVRFCNPAFERMFFYSEAEIQRKNLDDLIAPHDRREATRLSEAVRAGGVVHATTQRRRKDGTMIDVELHGVKVYSGDAFVGAFAIYQDITERKRSEEKLASLRKRLARAQEEERARIARDLHDDTGQRLTLLSIDLERLKQSSLNLRSSLSQELESLVKAASEIASDIHNVSRRLHPSQVDLLGLPKALENFCKDFAARNAMEIKFVNGGVPWKLPQDASLCLFRVAQEAIRNVHKHSGCSHAIVQLDETAGSLRLRVSDEGSGFDPDSIETNAGLGLLSMEERLRSLGGELFIHSRLGGGTCIEACLPLSASVPA